MRRNAETPGPSVQPRPGAILQKGGEWGQGVDGGTVRTPTVSHGARRADPSRRPFLAMLSPCPSSAPTPGGHRLAASVISSFRVCHKRVAFGGLDLFSLSGIPWGILQVVVFISSPPFLELSDVIF